MIVIDVNDKNVLIGDRAYEKLTALFVYGQICDQSSIYAPNWGCTRPIGHVGPHVAHGVCDDGEPEAYSVFVDSETTHV